MSGEPVISVSGLHKSYGEFEAVRGVDLEVARGEIFAFLGPNGAGKTTTVEILEGYRARSAGEVAVLGIDPAQADGAWRSRIGFVLQECRMEPVLTVRETLDMFAGYYREPRGVEETIELVGLSEKADERAGKLSGGQQRRLDVAIALIGDAELLFLDEPTTGFDPTARRAAWKVIAGLRDLGKTVFLTTHYMDEAQALADRVAVISSGRIVAAGTPDDLGGRADDATEISFELAGEAPGGDLPRGFDPVDGMAGRFVRSSQEPLRDVHELTGWALERGVSLSRLEVRQPSLEDVYLRLTAQSEPGEGDPAGEPQRPDPVAAGERR